MKKLTALLLTLVLVFALASPAMATNWSTPGSSSSSSIKITAFEKLVVTGNALGGRVNYGTAPADTAVYPGASITVGATIDVPKASSLPSGVSLKAKFVFDNATVSTGAVRSVGSVDTSVSLAPGSKSVEIDLVDGAVNTIIIPAYVTSSGSVSVSVSVGGSSGSLAVGTEKAYSNGLRVTVSAAGATVKDGSGNLLEFGYKSGTTYAYTVNTYSWYLTVGNEKFKINDSNGLREFASTSSNRTVTSQSDSYSYGYLNGIYEAFTKTLGFNHATEGVIFSPENIESNFGTAADQRTLSYGAYTGLPTVTPTPIPGTTPPPSLPTLPSLPGTTDDTRVPNTGDEASIVGIALIGFAMLAAGVLLIKKIRA